MRRIAFAAICLIPAALPAGGAWAQAKVLTAPDAPAAKATPDTAAGNDRYIFQEVDEGILRLDTQAGTVSICGRGEAGWICRSVPDDRQAFDAEVGRLQAENQALKDRLAEKSAESSKPSITGTIAPKAQNPAAEAPTPPPAPPPPAVAPPAASSPPPAAEAKAPLNPMHRLWQRLVEMMAGLRAELAKKT